MPFNHLILCHPLLLPPSIFPTIRVSSNESVLCIRWPKYWSFSFSISNSNSGPISLLGWPGWMSLKSKELSRVFFNTTVQNHQFFGAQLSLQSNPHIHTWLLKKKKKKQKTHSFTRWPQSSNSMQTPRAVTQNDFCAMGLVREFLTTSSSNCFISHSLTSC